MRKLLFIVILIIIVSSVGCKDESQIIEYKSLSITDQILELEVQREFFRSLRSTYDDYAKIHDWLYPENEQLKDELVLSIGGFAIKGEELIGLNIEEEKVYIKGIDDEYMDLILKADKLFEKVELSISDVYKHKSLDWYYVFIMRKGILSESEGETYMPSRYTLEKINEDYKIIDYIIGCRTGIVDEDTTIKRLRCTTFYSEPVTYIKTIATKN